MACSSLFLLSFNLLGRVKGADATMLGRQLPCGLKLSTASGENEFV